jgi:hypothetical protein
MMVEVDWKPVLIGLIIAVLIGTILGILTSWGDLLGYLVGSIFVGYSVAGNYKVGAFHGMIVGVFAAAVVLLLSLLGWGGLYATYVVAAGGMAIVTVLIFAIILGVIVGAVGGIIGVYIKVKS